MLIKDALELEKYCRENNKNYQHRGKTDEEIMPLALKSFGRLTDEERTRITADWIKRGLNPTDCIRLRYICQTNLFYLCKVLEKYSAVSDQEYIWKDGQVHNTHEEICNGFFVQKDPTYKTFESFATSYKDLKDRLILVPRGGFKSSIDMADCVQWIICFPEVTILILTGVLGLAKDFVKETRGHFTLEDSGRIENKKRVFQPKTMQDGTSSMFQILFPEHCIEPEEGKETEFQTPACRQPDKEPTIMSASIEQNLSGWHFGIMKLDDVVTNENSLTITRMESVQKQVSVNRAMMHPFGFFDKIGTWYDEADIYGIDIKYENKLREEGEAPQMKIYIRSAWWPTEEARKLGKIEEEMKESDWVLWFGKDGNGIERLTYKFLLKEKKKDPDGFAIKYENDPQKVHQIKFPRELLLRRTIPAHTMPQQGMIVTCVDTAYSTKSFADYTVLITALIYGGCFYMIDMVRGRFNEYELPAIIAATGNKWKPKRIAIEDSVGVRWLSREIRREMDKLGISIPVEYVSLGVGNKSKSKEIKAKPVLRLLGDSRLFFSNASAGLEELYNELEKFPKGTHDDIVSGLSILVDQFAAYADMEQRINFAATQFVADQKSKNMHDMIYGLGRYSKNNQQFQLSENNMADTASFQLGSPEPPEIDPLSDIFG